MVQSDDRHNILCFTCVLYRDLHLYGGQGPLFVGALGISSIIMAVYTVFNSMVFEKDPECNYIPLHVAGIAAGIIVILWVILLLLGLFF